MKHSIFEEEYQRLNAKQKQVVESIYGPIMVIAWPGTWKTQIIALRTANIILKAWVNPENILITTFTEAWVIAIKNRLLKFIGTDAYKVNVSTIHSFAQDIITSFPEKFAEYRASNTIDDIESLEVLTKILDENIKNGNIEYLFTPFDRHLYLRDIKDRIGKLKWEWISPEKFEWKIAELRQEYDENLEALKENKRIRDLEKRTKKDSESYKKHIGKLSELNFFYKKYLEHLHTNSLYDFSDMINFAVEKMKDDEDLLNHYAEKYQFIMLDEYQDSNNPQNEIMNLITNVWEEKNIMVVGDDDQSIYRFQWANIENMLDFSSIYKDTHFIVLEDNYRSAQSILDLSTNLIENNTERLSKKLTFIEKNLIAQWNDKSLKNNQYSILSDDMTEKMYVLDKIKSLNTSDTTFAVIVRSNKEVAEWTSYFQSQWIEVESKLKTNILQNHFVIYLLDFLHLIENPSFDDEKLLNIMRSDIIDIENIDVITLARDLYKANYARHGFSLTLWDILKKIDIPYDKEKSKWVFELEQEEKFKTYSKLIEFREMILEFNKELWLYGISRLFQKVIDRIWIVEYIEKKGNFSDLEDIFTLFNKIKSYNEKNVDLTLATLLHKFNLHKKYNIAIARQILKKSNSNIEILTAHSSKWLEYDHVFIPWLYWWNWDAKNIPDKLKLPLWVAWQWLQYSWLTEKEINQAEKESSLQEDRRLFFVAITRAKKSLTFSRPLGKDNKPYIDSPFIHEIGITGEIIDPTQNEKELSESIKNILTAETHPLINIKKEELDYIKEFLENYKLSPTDFNTFLEDPKIFLQNVVFKYPFTGNEFTIFWNVYHKVLEDITKAKIAGDKVELWMLTEEFTQLLEKQILTHEEKERLTKKWIEWLTGYYESFINNPRTPLRTEYNFRSRNVSYEGIPLTGKIDKIEKIDSHTTQTASESGQAALFVDDVAVVDYKTWWVKTLWNIKGTDRYGKPKAGFEHGKYFRQLLFYKLMAEHDSEFHSQYNIAELALDFVEGKNGEYKYTPVDFNEEEYWDFQQLLKESREKITSIKYWKELLSKD